MNNKIRVISKTLKWSVIVVSLLAVSYLLYSYSVNGGFNFNSDGPNFAALWQHADASKAVLMMSALPSAILWFLLVFWLCRLFNNFEQGEYFSLGTMKCYVWLVWIHVAMFVIQFTRDVWLGYYHSQFFEETTFAIGLELGRIFTLVLLVGIVHILKTAREVELENKEFI